MFRRSVYVGRLAFDSDSGFHISEDGRRVVTDDEGRTWRYAKKSDRSHNVRYSQNVAVVEATTPEGHGTDPDRHGHHWAPRPHDPHVDGLTVLPEDVAERVTSHTEAWR